MPLVNEPAIVFLSMVILLLLVLLLASSQCRERYASMRR
jgi:hypothetical protein